MVFKYLLLLNRSDPQSKVRRPKPDISQGTQQQRAVLVEMRCQSQRVAYATAAAAAAVAVFFPCTRAFIQNSIPVHRGVACRIEAAKSSLSGMDAPAASAAPVTRRRILRRENHAASHVNPLAMSDRITVGCISSTWCKIDRPVLAWCTSRSFGAGGFRDMCL